jgi:hypothetical protein
MRFPRPHRLRRVSVCSLSRQLGVGKATAYDLTHHKSEAVFIGEGIVLCGAIVVPEDLFSDVPVKMEGFDRNICAAQSSLEQTPEVLNALRVDLPTNIFIHMVHRLMHELHVAERLVIAEPIAIDGRSFFDVPENRLHENFAFHFGNDVSTYLPCFTVKHPEHGSLFGGATANVWHVIGIQAAPFAILIQQVFLAVSRIAFAEMPVLRLSANVGFIDFHRAAIAAAHLCKRTALHRFADAVKHEPCRLLSDAQSPVEFVAGDSVLAVTDHPDRCHPLVKADGRVFEDRAHLDGKLLLAAVAEPQSAGLYKGVAFGIAARTRNLVIRPAQELRVVKCAVCIAEVNYCLLESYGLFHVSHLQSKNRIARFILCVKYIIAISR